MDYTYIPLETILHMVEDMDIDEIESFLNSNKELSYLRNDPNISRIILEKSNTNFIPKETILHMVDEMDITDLAPYFSSSKDLYKLSNDPRVLRHISERFNLPYVSSFKNLLYFISMNYGLYYMNAKDIGDERILNGFTKKQLEEVLEDLSIFDNAIGYIYELIQSGVKVTEQAVINAINTTKTDTYDDSIVHYLLDNGGPLTEDVLITVIKNCDKNLFKFIFNNYDDFVITRRILETALDVDCYKILKLLIYYDMFFTLEDGTADILDEIYKHLKSKYGYNFM